MNWEKILSEGEKGMKKKFVKKIIGNRDGVNYDAQPLVDRGSGGR